MTPHKPFKEPPLTDEQRTMVEEHLDMIDKVEAIARSGPGLVRKSFYLLGLAGAKDVAAWAIVKAATSYVPGDGNSFRAPAFTFEEHEEARKVTAYARGQYSLLVRWMLARGHDRKTARGAARGVLPSALGTELIMSASVAQWRHIVNLRGAVAADAEIRGLAGLIGEVL